MIGTLRVWKGDSGYGFITPDDPSKLDIFVHISSLQKGGIRDITTGERLAFEEAPGRNGKMQAVNVARA